MANKKVIVLTNDFEQIQSGDIAVEGNGYVLRSVNPRIASITSSASPTPNMDTTDLYVITALAEAATFGAPTGTLVQGRLLAVRIKDNGTARTLNWNAVFRASTDLALPTTTTLGKTFYLLFMFNETDTKWDMLAKLDNV